MNTQTDVPQVSLDVDEDSLTIVLDRKRDVLLFPWQAAYQLGAAMEKAAMEREPIIGIADPMQVEREQAQVRLNHDNKGHVVMVLDWTDRVKLSFTAAKVVARAIKLMAQDEDLLTRKVRMLYPKGFRNGAHLPQWSFDRKTWGPK